MPHAIAGVEPQHMQVPPAFLDSPAKMTRIGSAIWRRNLETSLSRLEYGSLTPRLLQLHEESNMPVMATVPPVCPIANGPYTQRCGSRSPPRLYCSMP